MARPRTVDPMDPAFWGPAAGGVDPTAVDPVDPTATGTEVHGGPAGPVVPYTPVVTVNHGGQTVPGVDPGAVTPTATTTPEPPLPTVPAGPVPVDDTPPPLAVPPTPQTATGLQTFGVGGGVGKGLRTPSFRSNRVVGGGAEETLLGGITKRFDAGIPVAQTPLPSGLKADSADASTYTDEELLKKSILGRRA